MNGLVPPIWPSPVCASGRCPHEPRGERPQSILRIFTSRLFPFPFFLFPFFQVLSRPAQTQRRFRAADQTGVDNAARGESTREIEDGLGRRCGVDVTDLATCNALAPPLRAGRSVGSISAWNSDARGFALVICRATAATYMRKKSRCSRKYSARAVTNAGIASRSWVPDRSRHGCARPARPAHG